MPTVRELEEALFSLAPGEGTMDWDNVGHLVGNPEQEVRRVLVALDITRETAQEAVASDCQLIVSHHPLINCKWLPVQTIRSDTPQGNLLLYLIRHHVNAICMHTNLDMAQGGVNDCLAARLELYDFQPIGGDGNPGRHGYTAQEVYLPDFVCFTCQQLQANGVRYANAGKPVHHVAVGGGACEEFIGAAIELGCDTYVTADLSYHSFLDARDMGINLIDAGHFPTENPVCDAVVDFLREQFPGLEVQKSAVHREVIQYFVPEND